MSAQNVLVFSMDSFAGALLAAAAELAGYAPVFPRDHERPRDSLLRTRPSLVLVDCDHDGACTEEFFGPAMMMNAGVAIFSSSRSRRTLAPIAEAFGVTTFSLPIEFEQFAAMLTSSQRTASP